MADTLNSRQRLPRWLKMKMPKGESYSKVKNLVEKYGLFTICISGNCPNIGECWNRGTATFMILGEICTRSCGFCATKTGRPLPPDPAEQPNIDRFSSDSRRTRRRKEERSGRLLGGHLQSSSRAAALSIGRVSPTE